MRLERGHTESFSTVNETGIESTGDLTLATCEITPRVAVGCSPRMHNIVTWPPFVYIESILGWSAGSKRLARRTAFQPPERITLVSPQIQKSNCSPLVSDRHEKTEVAFARRRSQGQRGRARSPASRALSLPTGGFSSSRLGSMGAESQAKFNALVRLQLHFPLQLIGKNIHQFKPER
jgi:hypothetical protein